jgi:hypothetical protein
MLTLEDLQKQLELDKQIPDKDECSERVNATKARISMLDAYTGDERAALGGTVVQQVVDDDLLEACRTMIACVANTGNKKAMAQIVRMAIHYRDIAKMSRAQRASFKKLVDGALTGEEE